MSVDVFIEQKKPLKTTLNLTFLQNMCQALGLSYGVPNTAYALSDYDGGQDIGDTTFVLYDPQKIGRGFSFWADESRHDCFVRLNNPATNEDITSFYGCIGYLCRELKTDHFLQDSNETHSVSQIGELAQNITVWNASELLTFIKMDFSIVFGAMYPVAIEQDIIKRLLSLPESKAIDVFASYLHEKQKNDYYYAKASLFEDNETVITLGMYTVTEEVDSIFPLCPYVPFNYGVDFDYPVDEWIVTFVHEKNGDYCVAGRMDFQDFASAYGLPGKPRFDAKHVIIRLSGKEIMKLLEKRTNKK